MISYSDGVVNGGLVEFLLSISGVVCVNCVVGDDDYGVRIVMVRVYFMVALAGKICVRCIFLFLSRRRVMRDAAQKLVPSTLH